MNSHTEYPAHNAANPQDDVAHCLNCDTEIIGKFCVNCGEATMVHRPSAGEFLHEFIGHFVALEGKLWKTLQLLLILPGQLTLDYLTGRRVAYINPLRLYLTLSLAMFALIKLYGIELPHLSINDHSFGITYSHSIPDVSRPGKLRTATLYIDAHERAENQGASEATGTRPASSTILRVKEALGGINPGWTRNLDRFLNESPEERSAILNHGFLANLPYMLIGALPLFALYLKIIYLGSGRYYGEHLVFALHANAFAFLLASVMINVPGNVGWLALSIHERMPALVSPWDWVQLLPFVWLVAYLPVAMQHVYGGKIVVTLIKWLVLIGAHLLVVASLTVLAELIGIIRAA